MLRRYVDIRLGKSMTEVRTALPRMLMNSALGNLEMSTEDKLTEYLKVSDVGMLDEPCERNIRGRDN